MRSCCRAVWVRSGVSPWYCGRTAGTATAARLITGKQIKDGSITSKDLSKAVREQLAEGWGRSGTAEGDTGARGDDGPVDTGPSTGRQAVTWPAASRPTRVRRNAWAEGSALDRRGDARSCSTRLRQLDRGAAGRPSGPVSWRCSAADVRLQPMVPSQSALGHPRAALSPAAERDLTADRSGRRRPWRSRVVDRRRGQVCPGRWSAMSDLTVAIPDRRIGPPREARHGVGASTASCRRSTAARSR